MNCPRCKEKMATSNCSGIETNTCLYCNGAWINSGSLDSLQNQLKALGWESVFADVLVTRQLKSKVELIKEHVVVSRNDVFVGDTGEDILTGKELRILAVGVSSGFLSAPVLQSYRPDLLLSSVVELEDNFLSAEYLRQFK